MASAMHIIGIAAAAGILGQSARKTQRQALAGDLPTVDRLEGKRGAYLFDRAAIIRVRDQRIAAQRQRLDELAGEVAS